MKLPGNHRNNATHLWLAATVSLLLAAFTSHSWGTAAHTLHRAVSDWLDNDPAGCLLESSRLTTDGAPQVQSTGLYWVHRCATAMGKQDLSGAALSALVRLHPRSFHSLAALPQIDTPSASDPGFSGNALLSATLETESGFDQSAISHKNAVGIAQVLPDTAAHILRRPPGHPEALACLHDRDCNATLGAVYLRTQLARFRDLAAAIYAYNAGPSRAEAWIRRRAADPVAAIDTIPIGETRRHIRRLLANLWLRQLGNRTWSVSRHAIRTGHWPAAP